MSDNNGSGYSSEFEYVGGNLVHKEKTPKPERDVVGSGDGDGDKAGDLLEAAGDNPDVDQEIGLSDAISAYLSSFENVSDNVVKNLKDQKISFNQLSHLSENDLELLGVTNKKTQKKMTESFKNLPNQEANYSKILQTIDMQSYVERLITNMEQHQRDMKLLISAAILKFNCTYPENVIIDGSDYSTTMVSKLIAEIQDRAEEIDLILKRMKSSEELENHSLDQRKRCYGKIGAGVLGTTFILFALYKHLKGKLF
jgi:hypothetical protein